MEMPTESPVGGMALDLKRLNWDPNPESLILQLKLYTLNPGPNAQDP